MPRFVCVLTLLAFVLTQQGCLINDAVALKDYEPLRPEPSRAIAIYGVGVEASWGAPKFGVTLDEYSPERQAITGGCWRYNRMSAAVPSDSTGVKHFAFEVPPGHYLYSGFNGAQLAGGSVSFEVPPNGVVYLGDFIYGGNNKVELRRPLKPELSAYLSSRPGEAMSLAAVQPGPASITLFLCAP